MRAIALLTLCPLPLLLLPGCTEDDCTVTLTCQRPPGNTGGSGGTGAGGSQSSGGGGGQQLLGPGASCDDASSCITGVCTDGVCCDTICDGTCLSCSLPGAEGTCSPQPGGEDLDDECSDGVCSGVGACVSGAYDWGIKLGSPETDSYWDEASALALDAAGNVVVVGILGDPFNFGGGLRTPVGNLDLFIAKYGSDGSYLWDHVFGNSYTEVHDAASDPSGNFALLAIMYSGTTFDFGGTVGTRNGSGTILVSFNSTGTARFATVLTDLHTTTPNVAMDADGFTYVLAEDAGDVNFGNGVLTSAGGDDVYLAKFDASGSLVWTRQLGDAERQLSDGLALDSAGNILISGRFSGSITEGNVSLSTATWESFVISFDADGVAQWGRQFATTGPAVDSTGYYCLATDGDNNVWVARPFEGTINLGGDNLVSFGREGVLAQFSEAGEHIRSKKTEGDGLARDCAFAPDGTLVVTGETVGPVDFGGGSLPFNGGYADLFLVKFDPWGNHVWSFTAGDGGTQRAERVAVSNDGGVFLAGSLNGVLDFGSLPVITTTGALDGFVARFQP